MDTIYPCLFCDSEFSDQSKVRRHIDEHHSSCSQEHDSPEDVPAASNRNQFEDNVIYPCPLCDINFENQNQVRQHMIDQHTNNDDTNSSQILPTSQDNQQSQNGQQIQSKAQITQESQQAFNEKVKVLTINNANRAEKSLMSFLNEIKNLLLDEIKQRIMFCKTLKMQLTINSSYVKLVEDKPVEIEAFFATEYVKVTATTDVNSILDHKFEELIARSQDFPAEGSGLSLKRIIKVVLTTCLYQPFRGNAFTTLPDKIRKKEAILNPLVTGIDCFKWCIRAYLLYKKLKSELEPKDYRHNGTRLEVTRAAEQRISRKLARMSEDSIQTVEDFMFIDWGAIDGAVSLEEVKHFTENNTDISINVFGLNDKQEVIGPLYTTNEKRTYHVNLLYLQNEENPADGHYCWIKSKSRLINAQYRKKGSKLHICDFCLLVMHTEEKLKSHLEQDCLRIVTKIPYPNEILEFSNVTKQLRAPVVVYADFECAVAPLHGCDKNPEKSRTKRIEQHIPTSFGFYVKCWDSSLDQYISYRGEDSAKVFVKELIDCLKALYEKHIFGVNVPLIMTQQDRILYNQATICFVCDKPLNGEKNKDHCHLTGKFRGAAHRKCNLQLKNVREIPIFFHNLNYDSHLFIRELAMYENSFNLEVIPSTTEKYIGICKKIPVARHPTYKSERDPFLKLMFKDSFRFLSKSLDTLSKSLDQASDFKTLTKEFKDRTDLLKRKGVFPYHMIQKQSDYDLPFPTRDQFLTVSDEDYAYAKHVANVFDCKNLGDYSDLYLKTDVLILADIFEKLRDDCLSPDAYRLDPAHYLSAPSFSWDAMLKFTSVEIELMADLSMLRFVKKGIRGGLCQVSTRKAEARNHYLIDMPEDSEDQNYLVYFDKVNLYGSTMTEKLPIGNYKWLDDPENFSLDEDTDGDKGYMVEVDVEYHPSFHDYHNELPFLPESFKVHNTEKLCATLENKQNYIASLRNIQQAIKHGLRVTKLHRVLSFTQSDWLKPYIELNNNIRRNATDQTRNDLAKLMINAVS